MTHPESESSAHCAIGINRAELDPIEGNSSSTCCAGYRDAGLSYHLKILPSVPIESIRTYWCSMSTSAAARSRSRRMMRKRISIDAPLQVLVLLITDEDGRPRSTPIDLDLAAQRRQPSQSIASILHPITLGGNPQIYLDKGAT